MREIERTDVAIIGGGIYGIHAADEISAYRPDVDVTIIEQESELFAHASSTNQGQFHMGYMYSADQKLAQECSDNKQKFMHDFKPAVDASVVSLYGIHERSEVSVEDYAKFCDDTNLPLNPVVNKEKIFGSSVVQIYETAEKTFNSYRLRACMLGRLASRDVHLKTGAKIDRIVNSKNGFELSTGNGLIQASVVLNAAFAGINQLHERSDMPSISMQHDTFLHFVLDLPDKYRDVSATVVRGPYALLMSSDFRNGHILASGKYRKVESGNLSARIIHNRYNDAIKDAEKYLPLLKEAQYKGYTLGERVAYVDESTGKYTSKALVFENFDDIRDYHVILGGKVGCMFDIDRDIHNIASAL